MIGGVHRNLVIIPLLQTLHDGERLKIRGRTWLRLNLATALVLAALALTLCGLAVLALPWWVANALLCSAVVLVPALLFDFERRLHMIAGRYAALLPAAALFAVLAAGGTAWIAGPQAPALAIAGVLALAHASGAALCAMLRPRLAAPATALRPLLAELWPQAGRTLAGHVAFGSYMQLNGFVVGGVLGPLAVADFNVTRTFLNPVATLITAIDNVQRLAMVRAHAEGGAPALRRAMLRTMRRLLLLGLPYALGMALAGPWLMEVLFPGRYGHTDLLLGLWALVAGLTLVGQPVETALYILGAARVLMWSRIVAAIVGAAAIAGLSWVAGPPGGVAGVAVALVVTLGAGLWHLARAFRSGT
ncbi:lipopolysaccharide biosynthesis protein [Zavarzinia sp. CC-PAN008]|uniref:lipopolysaccharide biosynthesis protein n=1 Tax=Zavarzinia sp. CC-PAN008 TaxID=3243332 RepID=UPI003F74A6B5